ncbi:hypothetical protein EJB05_01251 [Eragrostis curvula]|uniref:LIM zinc-binding domain-containing protein n=1 Tax=Eragrostis curvula TaxID=38414 RepID=A0A5J9WP41_9POAL|nr:hypothetical protein EJB05_01251 [Eragrostis curvula]
MNWLCSFLKGITPCKTNQRRHLVTGGEENTLWQVPIRPKIGPPRPGNEELDHAISESLAEGARTPEEPIHKGDNNDEELATAIQDSLNMNPYNPHAPSQAQPRGFRVCGGCRKEIGHGHYLSCMGTHWHPKRFRCSSCGQAIQETEISTNRSGLIEYRAHPFWGQKYCPLHEHDSTPRCCSCEKMEPRNMKYMSLGDGRSLCMECLGSAVMDTGECQSPYHSIRDYYEGMNMKLEQQIPMLLVQRQALNEATEGESKGPQHMREKSGLCLWEEQTVFRRPRIGGNRLLDMRTQPQKLTRRCEVTAILVLYGLPRLLIGSILAQELMHAWLRLKGYRNLNPEVEEGICQVMSYLWLESEILPASSTHAQSSSSHALSSSSSFLYPPTSSKKGGISHIEKKLGEFFMHHIANDTSTLYGDGFRAAYAAVNKYGLRQTLNHIRLTGGFPV